VGVWHLFTEIKNGNPGWENPVLRLEGTCAVRLGFVVLRLSRSFGGGIREAEAKAQ